RRRRLRTHLAPVALAGRRGAAGPRGSQRRDPREALPQTRARLGGGQSALGRRQSRCPALLPHVHHLPAPLPVTLGATTDTTSPVAVPCRSDHPRTDVLLNSAAPTLSTRPALTGAAAPVRLGSQGRRSRRRRRGRRYGALHDRADPVDLPRSDPGRHRGDVAVAGHGAGDLVPRGTAEVPRPWHHAA